MPVPLLRLPYLAQREILENLELPEIIQLSATSTRAANLFRFTKPSTESLKITIDCKYVELFFPDSNLKFFHFYKTPLTNSQVWNIAGSPIQVQVQQRTLQFFLGVPKDVKDKMEHCSRFLAKLLRHLTSILSIQNIDVEIRNNEKLPVIFSHLKFIKFHNVQLTFGVNIKSDDLKIILETINAQNVDSGWSLRGKHQKKCQNVRQLPIENLLTSPWFDFTDAPNAKNILLYGHPYRDALKGRANLFIKSWIKGSHRFVENFQILGGFNEKGNRIGIVLKGIKTEETQLTLQELETFHPNECPSSLTHARDIIRESDGLRATVISTLSFVSVMMWTEENLKKIGRN